MCHKKKEEMVQRVFRVHELPNEFVHAIPQQQHEYNND
jgi:hypothetical protein